MKEKTKSELILEEARRLGLRVNTLKAVPREVEDFLGLPRCKPCKLVLDEV